MYETNVHISAFLNFIVWLFVAYHAIARLKTPIYHPFFIYLIYHFVGYVSRPFLILINGGSFLWYRIGFEPLPGDIWLITAVSNISLIAVTIGLDFGRKKNGVLDKINPVQITIGDKRGFFVVCCLLVIAGLYATFKTIDGAGLDSVLAYETLVDDSGGRRLVDVSGYVTALAEFLPIIGILLFFIKETRRIAVLFIVAFIAIRIYAGAQRLSFIVVLAALFFYYHIENRLRFPSKKILTFIILFAVVFDVIGYDRYALRRILDGSESVVSIFESYFEERGGNALTSDVVEYDVATAAVGIVSDNRAYTYGTQYLRLLIWPIPRQVWPDKPVYTSIVDLNDYGDFRYLTTGVYADTFMVLSFASLVPMMFLLGFFFSRIYELANITSSVQIYMFFWIVLVYIKTILRDGGVTVFYFWIFSFFAIYLATKFGKLKLVR